MSGRKNIFKTSDGKVRVKFFWVASIIISIVLTIALNIVLNVML
jgi:hypothetical protein